MHANRNCPSYAEYAFGDVDVDLYPFLVKYKDGRVERLLHSPFVPASENPAGNRGVATRDVVIDAITGVSARLFLPSRAAASGRKLPVVVYIHGGSFCTESAFSRTYHRYATSLAASAGAVVVSVEYRLAPEFPIPTAYDDAWAALRWTAALRDPWLAEQADAGRVFLAGDSAGGNIAYRTAVRAAHDGGVAVEGVVVVQPFFWGAERLPSEAALDTAAVLPVWRVDKLWPFVTAGQAGNDDPRVNPPPEEIASLARCRVLVAVAEKDTLRCRGRLLSAGGGNVTLVESEGEDHGFHLYSPLRATSRELMDTIVRFINQPPASPELHAFAAGKAAPLFLGVPSRPFRDIFGFGMDMKRSGGPTMAYATLKIGRPVMRARPINKSAAAVLPPTPAVKNFF